MKRYYFITALFTLLTVTPLAAQERERAFELSTGAEVVSSYIWRGQNYGHRPSIQPGAELSWRGFTFGVWGAFRITGDGEDEIDLYLSKEIGPLTISLWDYWSYSKYNPPRYFDYNPQTTSHMFEAQALLSFGDEKRVNFTLGYLFYGSDPSKSLYGEIELVKRSGDNEYKVFAGYQIKGEYYAASRAFVNTGISYKRELSLIKSIPTYFQLSFIVNPAIKSTYLTAAIGF